jgi:exosortase D (VPLPA-CTERM-specific)
VAAGLKAVGLETKEKHSGRYYKEIALLLALFVAAFWVPLRSMVLTWSTNEDYSYGFLIPVICAYLLWEQRNEFAATPVKSSWRLLPPVLLTMLVALYGILGSSGNIAMPVTPIALILIFAFCFGEQAARRFILPLGFLIFMVPIPAILERTIGVFLKAVSSKLGGELIRLAGASVHVSGNIIDLGVTQLQVVDACSGLRYLFPLLALGILYAHFFERETWKKIVCVLATPPIAVLTNSLRVGLTGILIPNLGVEAAQGVFHDFSGWVIFLVAFAFLFLLGRLLRFFKPRPEPPIAPRTEPRALAARFNITRAVVVSGSLLLAVAGLSASTGSLPPVRIQDGLTSFPLAFSDWSGRPQIVDPEIIKESGAEEAFSANYRNARGEVISLYMGYRSTAFLETENFFHSPTVCLPSSGLAVLEESMHIIPGVPQFGALTVSQMVIESLGTRQLVYFWFQTKDKYSHDKNINRYQIATHALRRDNTHALFIRPITTIEKSETIEAAQARLDEFVRDVLKELFEFLHAKQVAG